MATLKEIIQYSKANPNTDYAKNAAKLIQSGQFDAQAVKEGIDLSWAGRPAVKPAPEQPKVVPIADTLKPVTDIYKQGAQNVQNDINQAGERIANSPNTVTGNLIEKPLIAAKGVSDVTKDVVKTAFEPLAKPVSSLISFLADKISSIPAVQRFATTNAVSKVLNTISNTSQTVEEAKKAHPDLADALDTLITIGGTVVGEKPLQTAADATLNTAKNLAEKGTNIASKIDTRLGGEAAQKAIQEISSEVPKTPKSLQTTIDAINPDLTGKKLVNAYKQTVSGSRDITPSSIFKEQGLTADQQTINLSKRLQDVVISKDPIKNLDSLGKALGDTETKVTELLKGDPTLNFNADKPTLFSKLNNVQKEMPREFSAIKDSKNIFNNVIDFAKEKINQSEDTLTGLRDARTAFDAQAKKEYPNAFKEGVVDTKTPAGRAIKLARDTINEHLYNTSPDGSELRQLIGREADIFRATDNIAPKAAKGEGKNAIEKIIKAHPTLARYIKYGLITAGIDKAVKTTTGVGF